MADDINVTLGENTPEGVALKLMEIIANVEGRLLTTNTGKVDREWIIRTYGQCLLITRGKTPISTILDLAPKKE